MNSMQAALEKNCKPEDLTALLRVQKGDFIEEGSASYEVRVDRLDRCIKLLVENVDAICVAVEKDFGCRSPRVTKMSEIATSLTSLRHAKKHLKTWMKPEKRKSLFPLNLLGARSQVYYQAKGVVGLMTPWNMPVSMIFSPLTDIIAAGNRCMIKPSEFTPAVSHLMADLFSDYFDFSEVAICPGEVEVAMAFSQLPFDHLIFTGASSVGKKVMLAAAQNLTPVTLELGGKSPVIVSDNYEITKAAESIITAKMLNAGQVCISPDYVYVPEGKVDQFISVCKSTFTEQYPTVIDNPDYVSIINERNAQRLQRYLDDAKSSGCEVVELSSSELDASDICGVRIPPNLVMNPSDNCLVMQEEIFGPILIIKSYTKINDCVDYINDRPRPLALYLFSDDKSEQEYVLTHTTSGGAAINDIAVQFACDDMPFGGVGDSGMGNYHGREGFKTFSHSKAVYRGSKINLAKLFGSLPPYGDKVDKMLDGQLK